MTSQSFWQRTEKVVKAIKPLYEVLHVMDSERYLQMGFLYYMMERAKKQISKNDLPNILKNLLTSLSAVGTIRWAEICI